MTYLDGFFQFLGVVSLGLAIVGIVDSRAAKLYGAAWFASIDAKRYCLAIFKDSFKVYRESEGVNTPAQWGVE